MVPARWRILSALLGTLLLTIALATNAHAEPLHFHSADFLLSDSANPPTDSAGWQTVALPDVWIQSRPGIRGTGWYRLEWRLNEVPAGPISLYLPEFGAKDKAFINGTLLTSPSFPGAAARYPEPLLTGIDPSLLHKGINIIHLRFRGISALLPPQVGDTESLSDKYARKVWLVVKGPHDLFGVALALGGFMLMLWTKRPAETAYGYFGGASLAYAVWLLTVFDTEPHPLLDHPWLSAIAAQFINIFTFLYALRYGGWRVPWLEAVLWCSVPIGAVLAIEPMDFTVIDPYYWFVGAPVFIGYVFVFGFIAWLRRSIESFSLAVASTGCLISFVLYDVGLGLGPPNLPFALHAYSYVPLFLLMGWLLVLRFARSLEETEVLNAELEQRVAAKQEELRRNYAQMEQMTREAAVTEERRRIMSDMHDGIGGQLISTLSLVEHGQGSKEEVASALRECIDDLRLAIDSLEPTDDDLLTVLGNLRYRLEGRLCQNGITLDWEVRDVPKLAVLTPQNVLQILRILQEAFTNVLKHAHATRIRVATAVEKNRISIDIIDNGHGFSVERSKNGGRGLNNMKDRARKIGGDLMIAPTASGTTLSLLLPIG